MPKKSLRAPTDENLFSFTLEPVFVWLVAASLDNDTLRYGAIRERIEQELGFQSIGRSTRIGKVVGELMHRIDRIKPGAPLINVLVVGQSDGLPGSGAGGFMAERFGVNRLAEDYANKKYPDLWREYSIRAADEVHETDAAYWQKVHRKLFGSNLTLDALAKERAKRKEGSEEDGVQTNSRKYGRGGEGEEHKALRLWVEKHPQRVDRRFTGADAETEFDLLSGDRVDVMLRHRTKWIALEVKSRRSNDADYQRGVYQCVKYRAVLEAMDMRQLAQSKLGKSKSDLKARKLVEACLITEEEPSPYIKALLGRHQVRLYVVPKKREM